MKLDHLRYFVASAIHGSFAAAAAHLNISPSSIGYGVGVLEDELRTPLFIRKPSKGLTLTRDGAAFLKECRHILSELEALESRAKNANHQFEGELIVGCQEGLTWSLLPRAINILSARQPKLRISTKMASLDGDYMALDKGEIDVLVTFRHDDDSASAYDVTKLCKTIVCALMRKGHPLDRGDKPVSLKDLAKFPQIMNNETAALELALAHYRSQGLSPPIAYYSNVSASAQALVGQSDAVSLRVLRPATQYSPLGDELVYRRVREALIQPYIVAVKVKSRTATYKNKRDIFIETCKELFDNGAMLTHMFY